MHMLMRVRRHRWQWLLIASLTPIVLLPGGSAASAPAGSATSRSPGSAGVAAPGAAQPGHHSHGDPVAVAAVQRAAAPAAGSELALRLQALLGQHSVLAADFMRGRIRGDEDFAQAANAALGKNTDAMTRLVGDISGADAAKQFGPLWGDHVLALFRYAGGLADRDEAVLAEARKTLTSFELNLGSIFAAASGGRLSEDAAHQALLAHVDHLLQQADAYASRDYAAADRLYRQAYRHTYDLGRTMAGALLPAAQSATMQTPVWRLRSELGKLLAEHVVLTVDVTRAAVTNSGEFTAAAGLVNGNTRDLATAMDSLFGAPAAKNFQSLWAYHVEQLVAYAGATAASDAGRREQARKNLHGFEQRFATFLQTATGRRLDATSLAKALLAHDQMLLRHADEFGAKNYPAAHDIAYDTYEHMLVLARQLAGAFGATVAARLPVGGAQTGLGGMAPGVGRR
jgi:hypothetical protein